jgi:SAM-dependent methyltransferase
MMNDVIENSARSRRIIQTICDLVHKPLSECRAVDLGCAHGQFAMELARRGAKTLGIEGRQSWVDHANKWKVDLHLNNVDFALDDIRNLSKGKYGTFDIVICAGLLYHLDQPDVFELLATIYDVCTDIAIIETHVSLRQDVSVAWKGHTYWGCNYREHLPGTREAEKIANVGASLDNDNAFWLTLPSLLNALRHVGFSYVAQGRVPLDNIRLNGDFKLHPDIVGLVAVKGKPIGDFLGLTPGQEIEDWPEDPEKYYWKRPGMP